MDDFEIPDCPECRSKDTFRIYFVERIDIARGKLGNAQSGYENEFTYHPSSLGKMKGTKIKSI